MISDRIEGKRDQLIARIQEGRGRSREESDQSVRNSEFRTTPN